MSSDCIHSLLRSSRPTVPVHHCFICCLVESAQCSAAPPPPRLQAPAFHFHRVSSSPPLRRRSLSPCPPGSTVWQCHGLLWVGASVEAAAIDIGDQQVLLLVWDVSLPLRWVSSTPVCNLKILPFFSSSCKSCNNNALSAFTDGWIISYFS